MIDEFPEYSDKRNFDMKMGAGNGYVMGGRNFGKCEWEENKCLLADGTEKTFKSLLNSSAYVQSLNPLTLQIESTLAYFSDNGIRDCIKLTTSKGKEITVTENHPLLSQYGWKEVNKLKVGDFLATPRKTLFEESISLDKFKNKFNSFEASEISDNNIYWDVIKKIEKIKSLKTVAVSVPLYNNYISNNIYSHNTLCEKVDMIISLMLNDGYPMGITSYDAVHIRGVMEPLIGCLESHPIISCFKGRIKRSPTYLITSPNSATIEGINMNIANKAPGNQFSVWDDGKSRVHGVRFGYGFGDGRTPEL
jgi:hypothetical protein